MRVLFVFTNINTPFRLVYPNSIGALSAILKSRGFENKLFILNRLKEKTNFNVILESYKPHVVAFSGASSQFQYLENMAKEVKKWKKVPVIFGGWHTMLVPDEVLNTCPIDAICLGEGERAIVEYMEALAENRNYKDTRGFWFKSEGMIIKNEPQEFIQDLDSLPFMDRTIIDYQKDIDENMGAIFLVAGRGCSYNECVFCSNPTFSKRCKGSWAKMRSVSNVLSEIRLIEEKYNFEYIYFRDDTFTWDRKWVLEFCREYPKHFKYPFDILTHAESLDEEVMRNLKSANCACVWIGVDSGNEYIRNKVLKKTATTEKIIGVCDYLFSLGIKVMTTNMVGLPYETPMLFQDTVDINKRIYKSNVMFTQASGIGPNIFVFGPFPGTEAYNICKKENWLKPMPFGYRVYKRPFLEMPAFTRKEIYRLYRRFRYNVYKENNLIVALLCLLWDSWFGEKLTTFFPRKLLKRVGYVVTRCLR